MPKIFNLDRALIMCKYDVISIIRAYAFSYTAPGKSGPGEAARAQFVGFGCQGSDVLNPDT
jgi:hypothetical protein